ncbi:MAG: tRNA lysidine(34) synthetase TilS, partial [Clostridia bacterium]|nr:tRNA lysidine(34) synthetase TilS [Clostridia bacterium]
RCVLSGGSVSLPGHVQLTAGQDTLTVMTEDPEPVCVPLDNGAAVLPDGRVISVCKKFTENGKNSGKVHNLLFNNDPDCDKIASVAVIRTRRGGDRFRPAGRGVSKSLKKLFNELRIPEAVRDRLLLLDVYGEILWIESVGAAEGAETLNVQITQNAE